MVAPVVTPGTADKTLVRCPKPGVRMLVHCCAVLPVLPQTITLLTVPPVPLCLGIFLQLSIFFLREFSLFPSASPVSESFFQPFRPLRLVGAFCIYGFIAVPVPEVKRQPWGNPNAGFAGALDTY